MVREATATRVCGASRPLARRGIASTGFPCAAAPWRSWRWRGRTRSAAGSRQPTAARTCSSGDAGSWRTGPATWPAGVEGQDRSVDRPWPRQRSMAFPPGITVEGATPERGGEVVDFGVHHLPLPGAAPAAKIPGSLPPLPPPPVRRHDAPGEGADTRCRRPTGLYPIGFGKSVPTRVHCGFPGTAWTTAARASPSESGALGWSKA